MDLGISRWKFNLIFLDKLLSIKITNNKLSRECRGANHESISTLQTFELTACVHKCWCKKVTLREFNFVFSFLQNSSNLFRSYICLWMTFIALLEPKPYNTLCISNLHYKMKVLCRNVREIWNQAFTNDKHCISLRLSNTKGYYSIYKKY